MAAGFRSYAFWWFNGYSAGTTPVPPEPVLCPCPEYGVEPTLYNQFNTEASLSNQFNRDSTLSNQFSKDASLSNQFSETESLTSQWKRGQCNG